MADFKINGRLNPKYQRRNFANISREVEIAKNPNDNKNNKTFKRETSYYEQEKKTIMIFESSGEAKLKKAQYLVMKKEIQQGCSKMTKNSFQKNRRNLLK
jgi:hypothetical protein